MCSHRNQALKFALALTGAAVGCLPAIRAQDKLHAPELRRIASVSRPLMFEKNVGQAAPTIRYLVHAGAVSLLFERDGVRFLNAGQQTSEALVMMIGDASGNSAVEGMQRAETIASYFIGRNSENWHPDVPVFDRIRYRDVSPGVDLIFYGNDGQLEFDFVLRPGADLSHVRLRFQQSGARPPIAVDKSGDLRVGMSPTECVLHRPLFYQTLTNGRVALEGGFNQTEDGAIAFWSGRYNHKAPLIIDPVFSYSGFFGDGALIYNGPTGIATDPSGHVYLIGTATNQTATQKAFQPNLKGEADVFIAKFDRTGQHLIYTTYLGGSDYDTGAALAVDWRGYVYFAGLSGSSDFPLNNAYQTVNQSAGSPKSNGAFVAVLDDTGSKLIFSSYFGGVSNSYEGYGHLTINGVAIDDDGHAFVGGTTDEDDFPVTRDALETACPNICSQIGFLAKIDVFAGKLDYASFLGGSGKGLYQVQDGVSTVATSHDGSVFVAGKTNSNDFPLRNALYETLPIIDATAPVADTAAFLMKFDRNMALTFSTLFGPTGVQDVSGFAFASGLAVDASGSPYIYGGVSGSTLPLRNAYRTSPANDFLTKFNATGTELVYSTYLFDIGASTGGPDKLAVDPAGRATITGTLAAEKAGQLPVQNPADRVCAINPAQTSCGYLAQLSTDGSELEFSTFFNGPDLGVNSGDFYHFTAGDTLSFDSLGDLVAAGHGPTLPLSAIPVDPGVFGDPRDYFARFVTCPVDAATSLRAFISNFGQETKPAVDMKIVQKLLERGDTHAALAVLERFDSDVSVVVDSGKWAVHTGAQLRAASQQLRERITSYPAQ